MYIYSFFIFHFSKGLYIGENYGTKINRWCKKSNVQKYCTYSIGVDQGRDSLKNSRFRKQLVLLQMPKLQQSWPGFEPSILRHSGIWGVADDAVLKLAHTKYYVPLFKKKIGSSWWLQEKWSKKEKEREELKGAQVWKFSSHGFFLFFYHKASMSRRL